MLKKSNSEFSFPLPNKIRILALRVETSPQPTYQIKEEQLYVQDQWKIQIVYEGSDPKYPDFLEFPVQWEDCFTWEETLPEEVKIEYNKKPQSILTNVIVENNQQAYLNLKFETLIYIDLAHIDPQNNETPKPTVLKEPNSLQPEIKQDKESPEQIKLFEEQLSQLSQKVTLLEEKITTIDKWLCQKSDFGQITGFVFDSFRRLPISNVIIEICSEQENILLKTTTDNTGFYFFHNLPAATYEITINHPRFLPLIIKGYNFKKGETKIQDFLLRRA